MYLFKANDSEIKPYPLCLGNISKDFTTDDMKKTGLKEYVHAFSGNYSQVPNVRGGVGQHFEP